VVTALRLSRGFAAQARGAFVPQPPKVGRRNVEVVERTRRRRIYFTLMGICVALIVLAWNVVRFWSTTAAVVMSVVAAVIPPVAAFLGNLGGLDDTQD
jgi:hypothetical protein